MKLTNLSGLPEALVRAVSNDPYTKGDSEFSVTELISPPRQAALKAKHAHEIEEDVEDRLYSLYGQITHLILERANGKAIAEKRYFGTIAGARVSAQVDTLDLENGVLSDWKFTTAYKFKGGQAPPNEWEMQLNFQLELLRQNGLDAKTLQIIGLIRDFSKLEARRDANYPQKSVQIMPIDLWERSKTLKLFEERVILHKQARLTLPLCNDEERWARPTKYAVMREGQARAVKLFESQAEAEAYAKEGKKLSVEVRPGELIRCTSYCPVAPFCTQFQKEVKDENDSQGRDNSVRAMPPGSLRATKRPQVGGSSHGG
jgi:hypothetical protein